jgi:hypothetical protein
MAVDGQRMTDRGRRAGAMTDQWADGPDGEGGQDAADPQAMAVAWVDWWLKTRPGGSGDQVSLDDIERVCWRLSGWQVDQRDVNILKVMARRYAACASGGTAAETASPVGGTVRALAADREDGEGELRNCPHCWDAVTDLDGHLDWCAQAPQQWAAEEAEGQATEGVTTALDGACEALAGVGRSPGPGEGVKALLGASCDVDGACQRGREAGVWPMPVVEALGAPLGAVWRDGWTGGQGALVQAPDGAVWQRLGIPERIGTGVAGQSPLAETPASHDLPESETKSQESAPADVREAEPVLPVAVEVVPDVAAEPVPEPVTAAEPAISETERVCRVCGKTKLLGEFRIDARSPRGRRSACATCEGDAKRARRRRARERQQGDG